MAFEELLRRLEPVLLILARRYAPAQFIDDAMQEARIRIWSRLRDVTVSRPQTVRTFLINAAVWVYRDLARKFVRQQEFASVLSELQTSRDPEICDDLPGVLQDYYDHAKENGTIRGAHKAVGERHGVKKWTMYRRFREEAERFAETL